MKSEPPRKLRWLTGALPLVVVVLAPSSAVAGDAYFRGGIIFAPSDVDFAARWRADFGSDYPLNFSETVYLGFELQTSVYRQDVAQTDRTATFVPANGLVNVKYKSGNIGTRPYAGGGLGLLSTFVIFSGSNAWERDFGFQALAGVEVGRLSVELQVQRAFDSDASTMWGLYAGFVW